MCSRFVADILTRLSLSPRGQSGSQRKRLDKDKDALEIADKCACFKRQRLLDGASLAKTLVFSLLHDPNATGNVLAQTAAGLVSGARRDNISSCG